MNIMKFLLSSTFPRYDAITIRNVHHVTSRHVSLMLTSRDRVGQPENVGNLQVDTRHPPGWRVASLELK